jgi:hypothetical protein
MILQIDRGVSAGNLDTLAEVVTQEKSGTIPGNCENTLHKLRPEFLTLARSVRRQPQS